MPPEFHVYELKPKKMMGAIESFVQRRPLYQTLKLRLAVAQGVDFDGWWYGAVRDGEVEALMAISGHTATFHSAEGDASEALAARLLGDQKHNRSPETRRHQIMGDHRSMARFWPTFRAVDRQVTTDENWSLMGGGGTDGPLESISKRMKLRAATMENHQLVYEFSAELSLERDGVDPRRSYPQAHAEAITAKIASGRQMVGFEKEKPVLIGEFADVGPNMVQLQEVWVPLAFRTRKRLVGGALAQATALPENAGKEVLVMANSKTMVAAAERAGFEPRAQYRYISMLGR